MNNTITPKQSLLKRKRCIRPSPLSSYKSPLLNKTAKKSCPGSDELSFEDFKEKEENVETGIEAVEHKFVCALPDTFKSPLLNKAVNITCSVSEESTFEDLKQNIDKEENMESQIETLEQKFVWSSPLSSFKSPLLSKAVKKSCPEKLSFDDLKKDTLKTVEDNENIEKEIKTLEDQGYEVSQLKWYIEKLHNYNDIKDTAQMLMGRIAVLERTTIRKIHEEFGMAVDD